MLLFLIICIVLIIVGLFVASKYRGKKEGLCFLMDGLTVVSSIACLIGLIVSYSEYEFAKTEIAKIKEFSNVIANERVVALKSDSIPQKPLMENFVKKDDELVVSNRANPQPMDKTYIQEIAWKYNERIIEYKTNYTWLDSRLFLPSDVATLKLFK